MSAGVALTDRDSLGCIWRQRYRPHLRRALVIGVIVGLLVDLGLTIQQTSGDTLLLWSKFQLARVLTDLGLSAQLAWPGDNGEVVLAAEELARTPGLDAWAGHVSGEINLAAFPALLGGMLAFAVGLLGQRLRAAPPVSSHPQPQEREQPQAQKVMPKEEGRQLDAPSPAPEPATSAPAPVQSETIATPQPASQADAPAPPAQPAPVSPEPPALPLPTWTPVTPTIRSTPESPPIRSQSGYSYVNHWGLSGLPFENVPDPKFYFPAPMHEEALHRMIYGIETNKGALMLTGEIGCGKTLLSRELILHLSGQRYDVALLPNPSFGEIEFLIEVLYQLGIEPVQNKVGLLHLLNDRLLENNKRGKQTVIVVDEAQAIPDDKVFEELRLLLNFQLNTRFLLTLVLMGQPELNSRVAAMKQFAQRISIKYHLGAFSNEVTAQYVQFRLKAAHCMREVFSKDALDVIFERSGGIPRIINSLCDLCLLIGYMERAANIDQRIAQRAATEHGAPAFS